MYFGFTEEQLLLRDTVRDFLKGECTPERMRELWESKTGRSPALWSKLAEVGLLGALVPEAYAGLGLDEIDLVLLLEETGAAALAEPVVASAAVAAPLLAGLESTETAARWLPELSAGRVVLAFGHPDEPFVSDAHVADLLLLAKDDEIHAVAPASATFEAQPNVDPARRIFRVEWSPSPESIMAERERARALAQAAFDRGAWANAAQLVGVTRKLLELAVAHASERKQFGVAIGTFQAVKHMLADVQVRLDYARPLVHRAAHSIARDAPGRSLDVSLAKSASGEVALAAAKTALQVHGAIGYTWEVDLHVWMRRAWSLNAEYGDDAWHRARAARAIVDADGPAESFGYSPRRA